MALETLFGSDAVRGATISSRRCKWGKLVWDAMSKVDSSLRLQHKIDYIKGTSYITRFSVSTIEKDKLVQLRFAPVVSVLIAGLQKL